MGRKLDALLISNLFSKSRVKLPAALAVPGGLEGLLLAIAGGGPATSSGFEGCLITSNMPRF